MNLRDADAIDRALSLLAVALEEVGAAPVELVVIGGAAINILGFGVRPTKDVDVLAIAETGAAGERVLAKCRALPPSLLSAADVVSKLLGLDADWLNAGPAGLMDWGLPQGFEGRLTSRVYGPRLTVLVPAREDLICFKVYAAADLGPGRHTEDVRAMDPTCSELLDGVRWARTQDPSEDFRTMLDALLRYFGCASEKGVLGDCD